MVVWNSMNLFQAIETGSDIDPLLGRGESPNVYAHVSCGEVTPLHLAVYRSLPRVAEKLLVAGANTNSVVLDGSLKGLTAVDLALALKEQELVNLLIEHGGRPGPSTPLNDTLRYQLEKKITVEAATGIVAAPVLRPLIEEAQRRRDWDEADRLIRKVSDYDGEDEACYHLRIRGLIARGKVDEALEEASLVFLLYRRWGRYREALLVARSMRRIAPYSARPYDLEMEFLVEIGWLDQAKEVLSQQIDLHRSTDNAVEIVACKARFALLCKRPQTARNSRLPKPWQAPEALPRSNPSNLPALIEEVTPDWLDVWWESGESECRD